MLKTGWLISAVLLTACGAKTSALTEHEKKVVMEMTTDMKPRCVGRYLIDLPVSAKPIGYAKFEGVTVTAKAQSLEQFQHEMHRRGTELRETKSTLGYKFFLDGGNVRGMKNTQYFVTLGDSGATSDIERVIEVYKWNRGYQINMRIEAADSIHAEYTKKYHGTPYGISEPVNDVPDKTRQAFDLIERLQGRAEDVIPTEPGACFVGGFMPGKAIAESEEISTSYVLADKTDVSFSLDSFANLRATSTLLPRVQSPEVQDALKAAQGRVIRSGSVELPSGMKVDEVLTSALTQVEVQGHHGSLETNYQGRPQAPYIVFDMLTASPNFMAEADTIKQSSLTEGEAVALWDAVSRSLRPRPNAF
ncbi:T6SS immunity protein Tli4 family protein [Burkholderia glumae]